MGSANALRGTNNRSAYSAARGAQVSYVRSVGIESDKNLVLVRGAVPGAKNGYVYIKASVKGRFKARDIKAAAAATEAPAPLLRSPRHFWAVLPSRTSMLPAAATLRRQ